MMDCDSVVIFLKDKLPQYALDIVKDQQIDEEDILEMDLISLNHLGLKWGHAAKLKRLLRENKAARSHSKDDSSESESLDESSLNLSRHANQQESESTFAVSSPPASAISAVRASAVSSPQSSDQVYAVSHAEASGVSSGSLAPAHRTSPGMDFEFDVRAILNTHVTGRAIMAEYDETGLIMKRKSDMIHILTGEMIAKTGTLYPTTQTKTNMAKAIVCAFPNLHTGGKLGYESFYTPYREVEVRGKKMKVTPHGHLEERLKTLRKIEGIHVRQILKTPTKRSSVPVSNFDMSAPFSPEQRTLINELRIEGVGRERECDILKETFDARRQWVTMCKPTYNDFVNKFPQLKGFNAHFQTEFKRICPDAKDLIVEWEDLASAVIDWAGLKANAMANELITDLNANGKPCNEREMEYAMMLLPFVLQPPLRKNHRFSCDEAARQFIQFHPASTAMDSVMLSHFRHPLVVALGARGCVQQVFVTVEGNALPVQHGIVNAVYGMLQLYYMLDMQYADASKHILQFLQRQVLCIEDQLPLSRSVSDLCIYLRKKARRSD